MKKYLILFSIIIICQVGQSQDYKLAVGARIGDGLYINAKYFLIGNQAAELIVGFEGGISILGVTTFHHPISDQQPRLNWFYGFGGYVHFSDINDKTTFVGILGAIGAEYTLPDKRFAFSLDWNPALSIIGDSGGFSGRYGGVSARFILQ